MFRPYPPTRPPLCLREFRGRPLILWIARPGPALLFVTLGSLSAIGGLIWLGMIIASCLHPSIDFN